VLTGVVLDFCPAAAHGTLRAANSGCCCPDAVEARRVYKAACDAAGGTTRRL